MTIDFRDQSRTSDDEEKAKRDHLECPNPTSTERPVGKQGNEPARRQRERVCRDDNNRVDVHGNHRNSVFRGLPLHTHK